MTRYHRRRVSCPPGVLRLLLLLMMMMMMTTMPLLGTAAGGDGGAAGGSGQGSGGRRHRQRKKQQQSNRGSRGHRRPNRNHKADGIRFAKAGDLAAAVSAFRKAVVAKPDDAAGYNNLGVALMRQGVDLDDVGVLQQAEQAFRVSLDILPEIATKENLRTVDGYLRDRGAKVSNSISDGNGDSSGSSGSGEGGSSGGDGDGVEVGPKGQVVVSEEDLRQQKHRRLRQRVNTACQEKALRVKISAADRNAGRLPAKKATRALHLLELCGVVVLERLWGKDFMAEVKTAQEAVVDRFLEGVEANPSATNSTWSEQRSPGRYELLSPMEHPFTSPDLLTNGLLHPLMTQALQTRRIEVDTHSSVTSLGNTPKQHWHRDAGFIFRGGEQLPPHGLVVFVPLVDVPRAMGPTQFLTGSHIICETRDQREVVIDHWHLQECPFVGPAVQTPGPVGTAVIFDLRILHRGLDNRTPRRRPLLYLTFFQEWFVDAVNFNSKQTAAFDKFPPSLRKMLSRVDNKQYTKLLEDELQKLGVDPTALQSNYEYKKNSFDTKA